MSDGSEENVWDSGFEEVDDFDDPEKCFYELRDRSYAAPNEAKRMMAKSDDVSS